MELTGIYGEPPEKLIKRACRLAWARKKRSRVGRVGNCLLCGSNTSGAENNLCSTARAGQDCKIKYNFPDVAEQGPVPASPELLRIINQLRSILDS